MCLTVASKLKKATTDIYVAKFFNKSIYFTGPKKGKIKYLSPYRSTSYEIGEKKTAMNMATKKRMGESVSVGLHAFIEDNKKRHSFKYSFDKNRQAILVCKIPKGWFYYIEKNGDIVSNKLTVIEEPSLIKKHTSRIFEPTMLKYCLKYIEETYGKQVY